MLIRIGIIFFHNSLGQCPLLGFRALPPVYLNNYFISCVLRHHADLTIFHMIEHLHVTTVSIALKHHALCA